MKVEQRLKKNDPLSGLEASVVTVEANEIAASSNGKRATYMSHFFDPSFATWFLIWTHSSPTRPSTMGARYPYTAFSS